MVSDGVTDLMRDFDEAIDGDPARAADIGEQLIAKTAELGMLPLEAEASCERPPPTTNAAMAIAPQMSSAAASFSSAPLTSSTANPSWPMTSCGCRRC
jgi:hypothetical protein